MTTETMKRPVPAAHTDSVPSWRQRWGEVRAQFGRVELGFDWLRVYLGIGLMVRGILFAREPALIEQFIGNTAWFFPLLAAHGLVLSHIVGGLMLALGLCTRWAAAAQVPFVAGAVFLVHWDEGLLARTQSLEFAALVLVMLLMYTVCGAADFSLDHYLSRVPPERPTAEPALSLQRALRERTSAPPPSGVAYAENTGLKRDKLRVELAGEDLDLPRDPPEARRQYRELRHELAVMLVSTTVLLVLLAEGAYIAAAAWLIAALVLFTIWRVGQAQLD